MASYFYHLQGLLKKNYILWKRDRRGTLCELLVPLCFAFILIGIRFTIPSKTIDAKDYTITQATLFPSYNSLAVPMKDCLDSDYGGKVALAPNIPITQKLKTILESYPQHLEVVFFNDKTSFEDHITKPGYIYERPPKICFGVIFTSWMNSNYNYQISYNLTFATEVPYQKQTRFYEKQQDDLWQDYINSGFTPIINYVSNLILQEESGVSTNKITVKTAPFQRSEYDYQDFVTSMGSNINFYIVLPMIATFLRLTSRILSEKEKKIKEGMMIMGLGRASFYSSWIITYLIYYAILSAIIAVSLQQLAFSHTNLGIIFFYHFLFSIALITQSLFITVFFSHQRSGILTATVFFLLQFIYELFMLSGEEISSDMYLKASIFPHSAVAAGGRVFTLYENLQQDFTFDKISTSIDGQKLSYSYNSCIINAAIYLVLFLYLDQVFPNEFGQKKHPLFFLGFSYSQKFSVQSFKEAEHFALIEEVDEEKRKQEQENKTIKITNLQKIFKGDGHTKTAVNNLNIQMYEGQIFAFLGHNGAGKTTTLSILTGMIAPTSGSASIKGFDILQDMDEIRQILGVCPQHDILFDQLTVKEHLELFGTLKGMPSKGKDAAIKKIIQDVDLVEKTDIVSSSLSGGQKRKLSVAMAFIGGSEVIILDEPTSGMDVAARRHIWEMLKNYKSSKIVILTTHFMDEADFLGDRIGIISDGQISCIGSNVFLKESYGDGYNLTFIKQENTSSSETICKLMSEIAPESTIVSDVSAELTFSVPKKYLPIFSEMFQKIDSNLKQLLIRSYGISNTTLEQVFLKVASLSDNHFEKKAVALKIHDNEPLDFDFQKDRVSGFFNVFKTHFWALSKKRYLYFKRDYKSFGCEIFLPILLIALGFLASSSLSFSNWDPIKLTLEEYNNNESNLEVYLGGSIGTINQYLPSFSNLSYKTSSAGSLSDFNTEIFQKKNPSLKFGIYVTNNSPTDFQYTSLVNTQSINTNPISINSFNNAIINNILGREITITVNNQPLLLTDYTWGFQGSLKSLIISLIFSIGMAFIPASIITFIVREREEHIKHQQIVSGASCFSYWCSNFFIDIVKYLIPGIICPFFAYIFDMTILIEEGNFGYLFLIFVVYGFTIIPFVYVFSYLYKDYGNAQLSQFFINFLIGGIGGITFTILRFISLTKDVAIQIHWIFRVIPSFAFAYGVSNLCNRQSYKQTYELSKLPDQMDTNGFGGDLYMLLGESLCFILILFWIEGTRTRKKILSKEDKYPYIPKPVDEDVAIEKSHVLTAKSDEKSVLVRGLRKVFLQNNGQPKIAVDDMNFSLTQGEVFCFLGTNGAGKTTTMKMLTGEETIATGEVFIQGYKIPQQISQAQRYIGYCPQFDALLDNLTAREHLELYASIKGIPSQLIPQAVDEKLDEMNLRQFENICAEKYSGGNKRKLSVAIAMLANPPIVFLDEPSTGMDPGNRRFMWNVISRISTERKKSSIILTTHSMEEAEALGTKVGIVVGGNLQCYGSIQHLKSKFGTGFEIDIKTNLPHTQDLQRIVKGKSLSDLVNSDNLTQILSNIEAMDFQMQISKGGFAAQLAFELDRGNQFELRLLAEKIFLYKINSSFKDFCSKSFGESYKVIEEFNNFCKIKVFSQLSVGQLFGLMQENQKKLQIVSYMINQTSLEQIFNQIAAKCEQEAQEGQTVIMVPPLEIKNQGNQEPLKNNINTFPEQMKPFNIQGKLEPIWKYKK